MLLHFQIYDNLVANNNLTFIKNRINIKILLQ